jgi:hypothetical protein
VRRAALVLTPDCGIAKLPAQVLVAPILPLSVLPTEQRDGIRDGTLLGAAHLAADPDLRFADGSRAPFPESYADLGRAMPAAPGLLLDQRMVALSDDRLARLQEAWVRYGTGREISSTGTISAARGKRVADVRVLESSARRHTVVLRFDDGSTLVLYQDPRRKGSHLESVTVRRGAFAPAEVTALAGTDLVLRVENEDAREWTIACPALELANRKLAAADTTHVRLVCPEMPLDAEVVNLDRRREVLRVRVRDPDAETSVQAAARSQNRPRFPTHGEQARPRAGRSARQRDRLSSCLRPSQNAAARRNPTASAAAATSTAPGRRHSRSGRTIPGRRRETAGWPSGAEPVASNGVHGCHRATGSPILNSRLASADSGRDATGFVPLSPEALLARSGAPGEVTSSGGTPAGTRTQNPPVKSNLAPRTTGSRGVEFNKGWIARSGSAEPVGSNRLLRRPTSPELALDLAPPRLSTSSHAWPIARRLGVPQAASCRLR